MSKSEVNAIAILGIMGLITKLIRKQAYLMTDAEESLLLEIERKLKQALSVYPKVRAFSPEFKQIEKQVADLEQVKEISLICLVSICLAGFSDIHDYVKNKRKQAISDCIDVLSRFGLSFDKDLNEFAEYEKAKKILALRRLS